MVIMMLPSELCRENLYKARGDAAKYLVHLINFLSGYALRAHLFHVHMDIITTPWRKIHINVQ